FMAICSALLMPGHLMHLFMFQPSIAHLIVLQLSIVHLVVLQSSIAHLFMSQLFISVSAIVSVFQPSVSVLAVITVSQPSVAVSRPSINVPAIHCCISAACHRSLCPDHLSSI